MKYFLIITLLLAASCSPTCEDALDNYLDVCGVMEQCLEYDPTVGECVSWVDRDWYIEWYCGSDGEGRCYFEEWLECLDGIHSKSQCDDCWGPQWSCDEATASGASLHCYDFQGGRV